ncbi:MAG: group 1 truncated hemoglobin [Pseudomonadota bacterium]
MSSTFQKYGGFSTVSRVVMTFYEMVLDSDTIGHYFDDVDMPRLMDHQTKFVSSLMGGPMAMSDDRLAHVHRSLNITSEEFDEVVKLLGDAMTEHGMERGDIRDVAQVFETKRSVIVSAGDP